MIGMTIKFHSKDQGTAWPDLDREKCVHIANDAPPIEVCVLDAGMESSRPSVALRIDLPDGTSVIAETSARLLATAGRAIMARYPDLFIDN